MSGPRSLYQPQNVCLTWDLLAYEREMRSEVAINPAPKPSSEKMRCARCCQSPGARVLIYNKLILGVQVMRGEEDLSCPSQFHCQLVSCIGFLSFFFLIMFDAALQRLVCIALWHVKKCSQVRPSFLCYGSESLK